MFNKDQFVSTFDKRIKALGKAEQFTKETLRDMSRDLLQITHETQDIGFINRTVQVLTPMNRKVAIIFFKKFSGFKFDEDEVAFVKKDKKNWDQIVKDAATELEDPHFNLWTWAEKNVQVEAKKFSLEDVKKFAERTLKKAQAEGINQADVLKAFFEGGFTMESLELLIDKAE